MSKIRWRNLSWGLQTALGLGRRGFFIPYRHMAGVTTLPPAYEAVEQLFAGARDVFSESLGHIANDAENLKTAYEGPLANHRNSGYFSLLDSASTFSVVRRSGPARIIEVGSGSSTHVLAAAARGLAQLPEILCIDPAPRSDVTALDVRWIDDVLSADHVAEFAALRAGDIAFFDSSHVLFQGTDVDIIQSRILPALKPGVMVHVHDVFLPDPYPENWAHRGYTEQLGLVGWLLGGAFRPTFSSHYVATRMAEAGRTAIAALGGGWLGGGSLWMVR